MIKQYMGVAPSIFQVVYVCIRLFSVGAFLGGIFVRLKLMNKNINHFIQLQFFQANVFFRLTCYLEKLANKLEVGMMFCCHFSIHIVFLKFWHV